MTGIHQLNNNKGVTVARRARPGWMVTTALSQVHGWACDLEAQDHETLRGVAALHSHELANGINSEQEITRSQKVPWHLPDRQHVHFIRSMGYPTRALGDLIFTHKLYSVLGNTITPRRWSAHFGIRSPCRFFKSSHRERRSLAKLMRPPPSFLALNFLEFMNFSTFLTRILN